MRDKEFEDKTATQILKSLSSNDSLKTVLSRFFQIAFILPVSSDEKGFSSLNHVKTEQSYCIVIGQFTSYLNERTRK